MVLKALSYSAVDANPYIGTNFYRLKMVDNDGKYNYSNVVSINYNAETQIAVSPNPVTDQLIVRIQNSDNSKATLQVIDMLGRLLMQKEVALLPNYNTITLNVVQFATGLYPLKSFRTLTFKR